MDVPPFRAGQIVGARFAFFVWLAPSDLIPNPNNLTRLNGFNAG